jgi:hypothetical protein
MAVLVTAIHAFARKTKTAWMRGTSPRMTKIIESGAILR